MPCGLKNADLPDKRKTPKVSYAFTKQKRAPLKKFQIPDDYIQTQLGKVSKQNIEQTILNLTSFHNRHTKSDNINKSADWILGELRKISNDHDSTYFHEYEEDGFGLKNVVYNKQGLNNRTILFCAHYDTILYPDVSDISSRAPGANDNASGVGILLEISRIISTLSFENTIRFVFFSGEEQGFWGSENYANHLKEQNEEIHSVINLDMCGEPGFLTTKLTTNIDIDDGTTGVTNENNDKSIVLGQRMEQMAITYTDLKVEYDPIAFSDYMPFEALGYVCIGAYDGSAVDSNDHYHAEADTPDNLDLNFISLVTKMILAFLIDEAKHQN